MNKVKLLESKSKTIDITFNLTHKCNFNCYYCVAGRKNKKSFTFNEKSKIKIKYLIDSIYIMNPKIKINFLLGGGEPLLNKYFLNIVKFLLSFNNIKVIVITNGFLLGNLREEINVFANSNLSFFITYHYYEYSKFDEKMQIITRNLEFLKNYNINFKLNFLIPTDPLVFKNFKYKKNYIISKANLKNIEYEFNLIRENGIISDKYNKTILNYYNKLKKVIFSDDNQNIKLTFLNNSIININYSKEVLEKGYNNFIGYICYPFSIPTNILIKALDQKIVKI